MYEGYTRLKFRRDDAILTIEMSNPSARNAVDGAMHAELARVFTEVALDTETRVVVLTGDPDGKAVTSSGSRASTARANATPRCSRKVSTSSRPWPTCRSRSCP
jgi:enoyl-CoA hydratase